MRTVSKVALTAVGALVATMIMSSDERGHTRQSTNREPSAAAKADLKRLIRAFGWRCDDIVWARYAVLSTGATVHCNNHQYRYWVYDKGGRWFVDVE